MKVIVCGTRDCDGDSERYALAEQLHDFWPIDLIIHGACEASADMLADQYADLYGIEKLPVPANWEAHGRAAGYIRNAIMAEVENVSQTIAVWDGKSKGTLNMIQESVKRGIPVIIIPARI